MMRIHLEIKRWQLSDRSHRRIMNDLNRGVMEHQRDKRLIKHFQNNANTRPGGAYGYRQRTAAWNKRKKRESIHQKVEPNVYSGGLMAAVMSNVRITATHQTGKLKTRGSNEHRMADFQKREIEAMSIDERNEEAKWQGAEYAKRAFDVKYASRRRKVIQ